MENYSRMQDLASEEKQEQAQDIAQEDELLNITKTAQYLNISRQRVQQLIKQGRLLPASGTQEENGYKYLFTKNYLKCWQEAKLASSAQDASGRVAPIKQDLAPLFEQFSNLQNENKNLLIELGRAQGKFEGIEEQLYKTQHMLTERAESLFEKEAKIKELEYKVQNMTLLEEEKKRLEEETCRVREEVERVKKDHQEEQLKSENERKEKEELMKQLMLINMPWWKKFFNTKEKLEEEIQKKFRS